MADADAPASSSPSLLTPPPSSSNAFPLARSEAARAAVSDGISSTTWFIIGTVAMCFLTMIAVLVGTLVPRPQGEASPVPTILGFMSPVIFALLAGAVHGNAKSVDGRLTQLMDLNETQALKAGHEAAVRNMLWQLRLLDPASEAYRTLSEQINTEMAAHLGITDKRRPPTPGPLVPATP